MQGKRWSGALPCPGISDAPGRKGTPEAVKGQGLMFDELGRCEPVVLHRVDPHP